MLSMSKKIRHDSTRIVSMKMTEKPTFVIYDEAHGYRRPYFKPSRKLQELRTTKVHINSSLNESLENLMVLRLYKIVIAFRVIPNEFRGWGSMRRTKCDQDQGNRTLRSGVRGQNEGKIGTFGCDTFLTRVYITLNISKI